MTTDCVVTLDISCHAKMCFEKLENRGDSSPVKEMEIKHIENTMSKAGDDANSNSRRFTACGVVHVK